EAGLIVDRRRLCPPRVASRLPGPPAAAEDAAAPATGGWNRIPGAGAGVLRRHRGTAAAGDDRRGRAARSGDRSPRIRGARGRGRGRRAALRRRRSLPGAGLMPTVLSVFGISPTRIGSHEAYARELSLQLNDRGWRSVLCFADLPRDPVLGYLSLPNVSIEHVTRPDQPRPGTLLELT